MTTSKLKSRTRSYRFDEIQDFIDDSPLSMEGFAKEAKVGTKTLYRMKKGEPIDEIPAEKIAAAAGMALNDLIEIKYDPKIRAQSRELCRQQCCIAYLVLREQQRIRNRPDLAIEPAHIQNIDEGTCGSFVDLHLAKFARDLLMKAMENEDSPLSDGCYFWEEELGVERLPGRSDDIQWAVVYDTNDDSKMSDAGLGGQGVFSIHHKAHGLVVVVVIDYQRKRLFSATPYEPLMVSRIVDLMQSIDPSDTHASPQGEALPVRPSDQAQLTGAKLNLFLGKPNRVKQAGECLGGLLDEAISVFPFGGARGPGLTADGTIDGCVEAHKGMRYLDALPALLLVEQGGGVCLDIETEKRMRFDDSLVLFEALTSKDMEALATIRKKFIAAGTLELAKAILEKVREA